MKIKEVVKEKYGEAARRVTAGVANGCCGGAALDGRRGPITSKLYNEAQTGQIPDEALKASLGCGNPTALAELKAGAMQDSEYTDKLTNAGFVAVEIEPTRVYDVEDARQFLTGQGVDVDAIAPAAAGKFMGAFIRATKPAADFALVLARNGVAVPGSRTLQIPREILQNFDTVVPRRHQRKYQCTH